MSNHFPVGDGTNSSASTLGGAFVGGVQYVLHVVQGETPLASSSGSLTVPGWLATDFPPHIGQTSDTHAPADITLVTCQFATSYDGGGNLVYNYSGFDQDSLESSLAALLDAMASGWADILGLDEAAVQANMVVTRNWVIEGSESLAAILGVIPEQMTYPA